MRAPDTHQLTEAQMMELDQCVKKMRELGCIVFAYSPEDTWQVATRAGDEVWDERVKIEDLAGYVQEDDQIWELLYHVVQTAYEHEVQYHDDPERDERIIAALTSGEKLVDEVV